MGDWTIREADQYSGLIGKLLPCHDVVDRSSINFHTFCVSSTQMQKAWQILRSPWRSSRVSVEELPILLARELISTQQDEPVSSMNSNWRVYQQFAPTICYKVTWKQFRLFTWIRIPFRKLLHVSIPVWSFYRHESIKFVLNFSIRFRDSKSVKEPNWFVRMYNLLTQLKLWLKCNAWTNCNERHRHE